MKYTFAILDESGEVKMFAAPSEWKAKQLRRSKIKSYKLKVLAVSNITRGDATPMLPMMFNAKIRVAKS